MQTLSCASFRVQARAPVIALHKVRGRGLQLPNPSVSRHLLVFRKQSAVVSAGLSSDTQTSSAEARVKEKVDEARQQVKVSQEKIQTARRETEDEAEQIRKDQRFHRVKSALDLKEQGHNLDPSVAKDDADQHPESIEAKARAGKEAQISNSSKGKKAASHDKGASQGSGVIDAPMSKEQRTHENAADQEAQVPDGTISTSVCQRLLALEALADTRPRRKLVSMGEPVPQLVHHYAAAAWWAVAQTGFGVGLTILTLSCNIARSGLSR
ncbi:TPA: hypothetical protein ACH3X2_007827 [Trebouxia sp. C0005]